MNDNFMSEGDSACCLALGEEYAISAVLESEHSASAVDTAAVSGVWIYWQPALSVHHQLAPNTVFGMELCN